MRKGLFRKVSASRLGLVGLVAALAVLPAAATAQAPKGGAPGVERALQATAALAVEAGQWHRPEGNAQAERRSKPVFRPAMSRADYRAAKAAAAAAPERAKPSVRIAETRVAKEPVTDAKVPTQTTGVNIAGPNQTLAGGLRPPDPHGAAGRSHAVIVTNSHIDMYRKPTTSDPVTRLQKSVSLASFFNYTAQTIFDPRVTYDYEWQRWIVTAEAFPESATVQRFFIGISRGPYPTSTWCLYSIDVESPHDGDGDFFDYPNLGYTQDAVVFTANIFGPSAYEGAYVFGVAKARLYNCEGWSVPIFQPFGTTTPSVVMFDQNPNMYLMTLPTAGTSMQKQTFANAENAFAASMSSSTIAVPGFTVPPDADQPGTTDLLDTLDSRFVSASAQHGDSLWNVHTIALGSFPAPKFYQFDTEGAGANTIKQSGFYFLTGSSDDFNASISVHPNGNAFTTWTVTDKPSVNDPNGRQASVAFAGRKATDSAGTMSPRNVAFESPTFYNPSTAVVERWGDYSSVFHEGFAVGASGTVLDFRAYLFNETIEATNRWGTRIVRIRYQ